MKKLPLIVFACLLLAIPVFSQTEVDNIPRYRPNCRGAYDFGYFLKPEALDLLDKAVRLGYEKKYDEANAVITEVMKIEPNAADLYFRRAEYSLELKNYEDVFKDVQTGVSFKVNNTWRLLGIVRQLKREGSIEQSLRLADIITSSVETKYLGYRIHSEIKYSDKDFVGAVEDSLKSVEFTPFKENIATGYFLMPVYYLKNDPSVLNYHLRMLDLLEKRSDYYANNTVFVTRIRNCAEETVSLNEDLTNRLLSPIMSAISNSISIYEERGQPEKVLELIKRIGRYEPKKTTYVIRAQLYAKRKYFKEAVEDATTAIDLFKEKATAQADLFVMRGDFYAQAKEYVKALADFETAISLDKSREAELRQKINETKLKMQEEANRQK